MGNLKGLVTHFLLERVVLINVASEAVFNDWQTADVNIVFNHVHVTS